MIVLKIILSDFLLDTYFCHMVETPCFFLLTHNDLHIGIVAL